jgi:DNA mismatch repair protein MutS2
LQIAERTLTDLGLAEIARAIGSRCRTEPGKQRALSLGLLDGAEAVRRSLTRISEARVLFREDDFSLPLGGIADLASPVERAAKGAALDPRELIAIAQVLFAFIRVREALEARFERAPLLGAIGQSLPELERVGTHIDRSFEPTGEISDRASADLREARARARSLHRSIKEKIERLLGDEKFAPNLREPYFTLRSGRYVLPIIAAHRGEVPGIVHNASQSGQTLFVEPESLIGQGNDLAIAESVVLDEERRILLQLSAEVGAVADQILKGLEAAGKLDFAEGAARLAGDLDAAAPLLEAEDGPLVLSDLRHPLLLLRGRLVVANDLAVEKDVRALVISGPNAGGKTATLTAVGLCALMLRAGLPIPAAASSRLPLYRSIHTIVGDSQDLSHDLSTFSAHVEQLKEIARAAGPGSLVLIDEIAADTNPREGAALAIAVLEDLIARGALVLVTTHLEELKALPHADSRFMNGRVGFDPVRLAPTYRLQLGAAGASSAIDIAARVGLPQSVCERARELVMGSAGPFSKALSALEEERRRAGEEAEKARTAAEAAESERASLAQQRRELERQRDEAELRHRERMASELRAAAAEIRDLLAKLREEKSIETAARAQRQLTDRAKEEQAKAEEARGRITSAGPEEVVPDLRVGGRVRHARLGSEMEILELFEDEALVAAGPIKMRVPLSELRAATGRKPAPQFGGRAEAVRSFLRKAEQAAPAEWTSAERRCDVRGLRLEDALREVERFLDRLARSDEQEALIIHGHGTGALKHSIREYLASSPYVRMYRPGASEEGGDGVTVVGLRA